MTRTDDIRDNVARRLDLPFDHAFGGQELSSVPAASSTVVNSIDLLGAFVGALAEQGPGDRIGNGADLATFTLDHSAAAVVDALGGQLASAL
jgi:hypothetical protein